jgi:glycosyl transferase family 29 (putative sialyltransferase)
VKVVVIGNSYDLLARDHGEEIDEFDRVVRLNAFRLRGVTRQVGSKIDIVSICLSPPMVKWALCRSADLICQATEIWTPSWRGEFSEDEVASAMTTVKRNPNELVFCDDTDHKELMMKLRRIVYETAERRPGPKTQTKAGQKFLPTTGFQTIYLARERFPTADLYITGFGLNSPISIQRFDSSGVTMWPGHDIPAERELLIKGIRQGLWKKL